MLWSIDALLEKKKRRKKRCENETQTLENENKKIKFSVGIQTTCLDHAEKNDAKNTGVYNAVTLTADLSEWLYVK